jgi:hypothetical protein
VSPLDPQAPPAGEEIHLPGPSLLPLVTLAIVGITLNLFVVIVGCIITLVCVVRWIGGTRHEVDELPLD